MSAGQRSFFRPDGMVLPSPVPGRPIGGRRKFHRFVCGHARRAATHHHQAVGQHLQQTGVHRNLCAHDERCYCVRYDGRANENVYQAIGDLGYLLDKDDYLELFGRFSALVARATSAMPFWAVCNRPVGFGMDLGCHWRLGRLYGPRIVLSIVRHGDVLPGECFCTTHAEHHETTGGIALFRAGRRRR